MKTERVDAVTVKPGMRIVRGGTVWTVTAAWADNEREMGDVDAVTQVGEDTHGACFQFGDGETFEVVVEEG